MAVSTRQEMEEERGRTELEIMCSEAEMKKSLKEKDLDEIHSLLAVYLKQGYETLDGSIYEYNKLCYKIKEEPKPLPIN